jgi:hypothetical protein
MQGSLQWAAQVRLNVAGCKDRNWHIHVEEDTCTQSAWAYLSKYRQMPSKFSSDEAECVTLDFENAEWRVVTGLNAVCVITFGYE